MALDTQFLTGCLSSHFPAGQNSGIHTNARFAHPIAKEWTKENFEASNHVVQQGLFVDSSALYVLLKRSIRENDLVLGAQVHALVAKSGYESNVFLANHIIRMYASHGRLDEATRVFGAVPTPDRYMWTSIILAHATHQQPREAMKFYREMRESLVMPDNYTFVAVLKACASAKDLSFGREVHAHITGAADKHNVFVGTSLVNMYAKCLSLEDARQVFESLPRKNVATWNAMIAGYAQHGLGRQALDLYVKMQKERCTSANHVTFQCLLQACGSMGDLHEGKHLHAQIYERGLDADVVVSTCLLDMYAKCGSLDDARRVFNNLPTKDVVSWTAMIAGYAQNGLAHEALTLYASMHQVGIKPTDAVTFVCLLQACADIGALHEGKQIHTQVRARGLETNVVVGNGLVNMYAKCGSLGDARKVFDNLSTKDVVTWNAMIAGYAHHGHGQEAFTIYESMQQQGITPADAITFTCLLQTCVSIEALHQGKQLHAQILESGLEGNVILGNCLVNMYAKCGSLEDARRVFDNLPDRDVITWTAMITGYTQHGLGQEALALYVEMQLKGMTTADHVMFMCLLQACTSVGDLQQGRQIHVQIQEKGLESDVVVSSSLVNMYANCGSLADAREVFKRLRVRNLVTLNAIISGYVDHGLGQEALSLFESLQEGGDGLTPADHVTFLCLLQACTSNGALHQGKELHLQICERGLEANVFISSCLIRMYSKCGSLEDARRVFDKLPTKDVVTWTAMIAGYSEHGLGQEALGLYASMQQEGITTADHVTFLCLLPACASLGALHQGKQLHAQIQERGLEAGVMVGNCLVDMYAKCGSLVDARRVFDRLQTRDVVTWNSMLMGYAENNDGQMAMQCFKDMLQQGFEPNDTTFICLLVACSHAGLVNEGQRYFKMMVEDGVVPSVHHFNCMVDLLGRSGRLNEAEAVLQTMPFENDVVGWTSLLSACKSHGDIERGRRCFNQLIEIEPKNAAAYVLLGSIYANAGRWRDVNNLENQRKLAGAWKKPAKAYIEVKSKVQEFTVGEERSDISSKVRSMNSRLQEQGGHEPQTSLVLNGMSEQQKKEELCGHAEKLALAYGLLNTPDGTSLLVTKNLRMCNDCHSSTKIMSRLEKREVIVRDAHRVHRFRDGSCSCGDWH